MKDEEVKEEYNNIKKNKKTKSFWIIIITIIILALLNILVWGDIISGGSGSSLLDTARFRMDSEEIRTFNNYIQQYIGTNVRGSIVKALYSEVMASNQFYIDDQVKINGISDIAELEADKNKITPSSRYTIKVVGFNERGLITEITVTPVVSNNGTNTTLNNNV